MTLLNLNTLIQYKRLYRWLNNLSLGSVYALACLTLHYLLYPLSLNQNLLFIEDTLLSLFSKTILRIQFNPNVAEKLIPLLVASRLLLSP